LQSHRRRWLVSAPRDVASLYDREKRRFYIGAGVFSILLAFAGFGPSLIDHSRRHAPPEALYIAHGATALA